jgi:TolB protein
MVMYATTQGNKGILAVVSVDGLVKYKLPSADGDVREPAWSPYFK